MRVAFALALFALALAGQANADPEFWKSEGWKTDFTRSVIDLDEIMSGGPPRDGIPPIDDPQFTPVAEATYAAREPVISLGIGGDRRAYPL